MADEMTAHGAQIKRRNPWGVLGLTLVTFGVYHFVWYYKINCELRDYRPARVTVNPTLSVVAAFISPFSLVSLICTTIRIRHAQTGSGARERISIAVTLLLLFVACSSVYMQSQLNKAWDVEFATRA